MHSVAPLLRDAQVSCYRGCLASATATRRYRSSDEVVKSALVKKDA